MPEETGLELLSSQYLLEHESDVRYHIVFKLTTNDAEPTPGMEIAELMWWDGQENIEMASSLTPVLAHPAVGFLPPQT